MEKDYEPGDRIQYMLPDKDGKAHWFDGVIHAVRQYVDDGKSFSRKQTYLVDTGRDTRVDEYAYDVRGREIDKRLAIEQAKGADLIQAVNKIAGMSDLPKSKIVTDRVRQPEQIELAFENIRLPQ